MSTFRTRINHQIQASELRVLDEEGESIGVMSLRDALVKAEGLGLDLIEISPGAVPPVAKIMDFGKFQYAENKKQKAAKVKVHRVEVKQIQIKIGTGEHDLALKAKKASEWLAEGHRLRVDLYVVGRAKYMDLKFLKERLERILKLISVEYKISEAPQKGPKGVTMMIEKS